MYKSILIFQKLKRITLVYISFAISNFEDILCCKLH